jgi:hypothetical protein
MRFWRYLVLLAVGVVLWFVLPPRAAEVWELPYSSGSGAKAGVVTIGGHAFVPIASNDAKATEQELRRIEKPSSGTKMPKSVEYVAWFPRFWRDDTGSPARPEVRLWRVFLFLICATAAAVALFAIIADVPPAGAAVGLLAGLVTAVFLLAGCTLFCDWFSQSNLRGNSALRLPSESTWDWFFWGEFLALTLGAVLGAVRGIFRSGAAAKQRAWPRVAFGAGLMIGLFAACWVEGFGSSITKLSRDERDRFIDGRVATKIAKLPDSFELLAFEGGAGEEKTGLISTNPAEPAEWLSKLEKYGRQLTSCCAYLRSAVVEYSPNVLRPEGVVGSVVAERLKFPRSRSNEPARPSQLAGSPSPPVQPDAENMREYYKQREQYAAIRRAYLVQIDTLRNHLTESDRLLASWPTVIALDDARRALDEFARYTRGLPEVFFRPDAIDELISLAPRNFGQSFLQGEVATWPLNACLMVEDATELAGRFEAAMARTRGNTVEFLRLQRERVALLMSLLPQQSLGSLSLAIFSGSQSDTMRRRYDLAVQALGPAGLSQDLVDAWTLCNQAHQAFADKLATLRRENLRRLGLPGLEPVHQQAMMRLEEILKELFSEVEKKPSEDDLYPPPKVQPGSVGPQWTPEEAKREAFESLALNQKWGQLPAKYDTSLARSVTEEIGLKMDEKLQKILRINPVTKLFDPKYTFITKKADAVKELKNVALNELSEFFRGLSRNFGANKAAAQPWENWAKDEPPQKANRSKIRGYPAEPENEKYRAKELDIVAANWANDTAKDGRAKLTTESVDFVPTKESKAEDRKKAYQEFMSHADRFLACINQVAASFRGSPKDPGEDLTRELGLWWNLFYAGEGDKGIPNPGDALDESRRAAKGELSAEAFTNQAKQEQEESPPDFKGKWPTSRPEQLTVIQRLKEWGMKLEEVIALTRNLPGVSELAGELYGLTGNAKAREGDVQVRKGDPGKEPQ